jgi:hypothetical protein
VNVINTKKDDFVKAEMLARESLRIRTRLYDNDAQYVGNFVALLAQTLSSQNKSVKNDRNYLLVLLPSQKNAMDQRGLILLLLMIIWVIFIVC